MDGWIIIQAGKAQILEIGSNGDNSFIMDQEDEDFNIFNEVDGPISERILSSSPVYQLAPQPRANPDFTFKAINPKELFDKMTPEGQQFFGSELFNHKVFPGINHFFEMGSEEDEFIEDIHESVFEPNWYDNALGLADLFDSESPQQMKQYTDHLNAIKDRVDKVHNQTMNSISVNRAISSSFYEHFENFLYIKADIAFLKSFEDSWETFIIGIKDLSGPGPDLLAHIYEFWMNNFKNFTNEIWKYSEKFTLSFLKKNKDPERDSQSSGVHSNSSFGEKRKQWKSSEMEILEKIIDSDGAFTQSSLNRIANELSRTPASISSKIQKMLKAKKRCHNPDFEESDSMTLMDRAVEVLKNYPGGLSRESVIERINEHYEMGYDMSWTKSIAQILSSRPEFVRVKGTFSLVGSHSFDIGKKTFKDKVVNCLLKCPEQRGDLKKIVAVYTGIYEKSEGISILSEERIKALQASISKALCRYDIFDKTHSKTVYKLRQFCSSREMELDIESFFS